MGAFDHLEWTYDGAFEQLFGLGRGEFEQKFSKNSNPRRVARGGMLKLRFDWYIKLSLRSWRDLARECFCFGSEAVNASGDAVRGSV